MHRAVTKFKKQETRAIEELFIRLTEDLRKTERLVKDRDKLPEAPIYEVLKRFIGKMKYQSSDPDELIVLDFISGMTDNYVISCLDEIFVPKHIC